MGLSSLHRAFRSVLRNPVPQPCPTQMFLLALESSETGEIHLLLKTATTAYYENQALHTTSMICPVLEPALHTNVIDVPYS